ncbi:FliH/SctL family protein [Nocardioides dongkuii]|uniref:FliH/SctL family protein n=1 Tax=Nocardioides dongkuii TaxID=2760089 RepID=UPI0015FA1DB5|nr:FliH/SctL family protein [Nocardioides dongkuii]
MSSSSSPLAVLPFEAYDAPAAAVLRGPEAVGAVGLVTPELRDGSWTRLGDRAVLGDEVTERALGRLAESTAAAARAQGYAVGWAEGRREAAARAADEADEAAHAQQLAERRRQAEHADAVAALVRAAASFQDAAAAVSAAVEDEALRLARELTAALLGRELATAADPAGDVVRRALEVLPDGVPTTVRVHPDVRSHAAAEALAAHGVTVVADPTLGRHDAVVETATTVVDLGVDAALDRVREALA